MCQLRILNDKSEVFINVPIFKEHFLTLSLLVIPRNSNSGEKD